MGAEILTDTRIAPSILAGDMPRLGEQVDEVMAAGARVIHLDVMDGHFVPPITFGPPMVEMLKERVHDAGGYLDVHLMIELPERQIEAFASAGADGITIHYEATPHIHFALNAIREAECTPGLVLNPGTPPDPIAELGDLIELVLCMTVNPGWGGQKFIESSTDKLRRMRELMGEGVPLEVDGGIGAETAPTCAEAGANLFVAGSSVFGADDPAEAYREIAESVGAV